MLQSFKAALNDMSVASTRTNEQSILSLTSKTLVCEQSTTIFNNPPDPRTHEFTMILPGVGNQVIQLLRYPLIKQA